VLLFGFIKEEMQKAYLPEFICDETYAFIEKLASIELQIRELKEKEKEPEPSKSKLMLNIPMDGDDEFIGGGTQREGRLPLTKH
jgi:hypothetical protein